MQFSLFVLLPYYGLLDLALRLLGAPNTGQGCRNPLCLLDEELEMLEGWPRHAILCDINVGAGVSHRGCLEHHIRHTRVLP